MTSRQNFEDRKGDTTREKTSQQKKNTTIKHPDKMDSAAENGGTRSTSRTSCRENEKSSPTPSNNTLSTISETSDISDTLEQAAGNISELLESISRWKAEEKCAKSEADDSEGESSAACCTHQKVDRHLTRFFDLRRVFAEYQGEALEVIEEDVVPQMDFTQGQEIEHHATVSTEKSCDFDMTQKKSVSRHGSKIYQKMKSAWKTCLRLLPRKKDQPAEKQDLDETVESYTTDSNSVSPRPADTGLATSVCSSSSQPAEHREERLWIMEDNDAETADLMSEVDALSQEDHKDTCKTSLAVRSQKSCDSGKISTGKDQLAVKQNLDEMIQPDVSGSKSASLLPKKASSTVLICSEDISSARLIPLISSLIGSTQLVEHHEPSLVHLGAEKTVDELSETHSSDMQSILSSPKQMSPITSAGSSEDISAVEKADWSSVSLAVTQFNGLQNTFYTLVKEFFDGLSEKHWTEISRGICYMNVKDKLLDMCVDVLMLILQTISDTLMEAIRQYPTTFQQGGIDTFRQALLSELLWMKFDITEDNIQQTLGSFLGNTFCDVVSMKTSIRIPPKFKEAIVKKITDEVSSAASVAIPALEDGESSVDASTWCQFSACRPCKKMLAGVKSTLKGLQISKQTSQTVNNHSDAPTIKVHNKRSRWWSCFCRQQNKIQAVSAEQMDMLLNTSVETGLTYPQDDKDKTTNEIKISAQDTAVGTKRPSLLKRIRRFCCCLCCCSGDDVKE